MVRVVNKWIKPQVKKKQTRKSQPYVRAEYPGQKVQIDVKFVPAYCVTNGCKYYQYTAVDECSRWTFREMYDEHSTYSSVDFLKKLIQSCPFPIREIQTDNGTEWTRALVSNDVKPSLFEKALMKCDIKYHRIRVATPRHNGKVERQHRTDENRFYRKMKMYNLEDGMAQLAKYNNFLRAHRSYLVNMEYIKTISSKAILMVNQDEIPVPHGKCSEIKNQYLEYAFSKDQVVLA